MGTRKSIHLHYKPISHKSNLMYSIPVTKVKYAGKQWNIYTDKTQFTVEDLCDVKIVVSYSF